MPTLEAETVVSIPRNKTPPSRVRYRMVALTLALTAVAYLDRVCISTAAPSIKFDLHLTETQMGYIFSAFTFAYALFEIPSGWAADRFGPRRTLIRIVLWWSAMTAATGWAQSFRSLFFVRLLFGMGEAGTFPCITRAYSHWLPPQERGRAFGLAVAAAALGGAVTQPLVVWILGMTSWRWAFFIFGLVGVAWTVAWCIWFRDNPHEHHGVNKSELALIGSEPPVPHPPVPWGHLLKSRNLWAICFMYAGMIYGWYFYLTWLPTYLLKSRGFNLHQVGWLAALPLLSIAVGVSSGGWISDILSRHFGVKNGRRLPGLIGLPLAAIAILAAIGTHHPLAAALYLALAAGLAALGTASAWAVSLQIGGQHSGVVSGTMNMFGNLGGALSPIVVGICLQHWNSWNLPLVTVAVFYLFSGACWLWIDPLKTISGKREIC